ncbi:MAG: CoA-binding protein [Acidobacteriota bacterium]|nr:CoA-binding protein [Acidobacteriota bacterium]
MKTPEPIADFLQQKRIAVTGVSRAGGEAANVVYRKLRSAGYEVFAVNPNAERLEGDPAYPDLAAIPGAPVDGVVVASHPSVALGIVRQCAELGIPRVWMHRSFGRGSVSQPAVERCREAGIEVIAGGCPMMFCPPVDLGHRCMRWILARTGGIARAA